MLLSDWMMCFVLENMSKCIERNFLGDDFIFIEVEMSLKVSNDWIFNE